MNYFNIQPKGVGSPSHQLTLFIYAKVIAILRLFYEKGNCPDFFFHMSYDIFAYTLKFN